MNTRKYRIARNLLLPFVLLVQMVMVWFLLPTSGIVELSTRIWVTIATPFGFIAILVVLAWIDGAFKNQ